MGTNASIMVLDLSSLVGAHEPNCELSGGRSLYKEPPGTTQALEAVVCWMDEHSALRRGDIYRIKHTTRSAKAIVTGIGARFGITSLTGEPDAESLGLNEIGRVSLKVSAPLACDDYTRNRVTGRLRKKDSVR